MHILVLHSDVAPDAPPDELDTLVTAEAVVAALRESGHAPKSMPFVPDPVQLESSVAGCDLAFNLVESIHGQGILAAMAPAMLERLAVRYTGADAAAIALTCDKPAAKRILRAAGLPTPDWSEPPEWGGLSEDVRYIVKSVTEDASLGLDDEAVVAGRNAVRARARGSAAQHRGRWFAEAYVEGREFNVAVLDEVDGPRVLPVAEMRFVGWAAERPRIVGYAAKWDEASDDAVKTVRGFGLEKTEPALDRRLRELALEAWALFSLKGYARVDFRVDAAGNPMILEINPNPCLEPQAGFAAAAQAAGYSYADLIEGIVHAAIRN